MNPQASTTLTIDVSDVKLNEEHFETESGQALLAKAIPYSVEASSIKNTPYVTLPSEEISAHHFLLMLDGAFNGHKPIIISPDHIWLLICQGVAQHIKENAEGLRDILTYVKGKKVIRVRRDHFVKGGRNDWEGVFPEFSNKVNEHLKEDLYSRLVLEFSTTTMIEKTAFEIAFMDAMSAYFEYELITRCGIPQITLEGTIEDYQKMFIKLKTFDTLKLDWWTNKIIPLIEEFIQALSGNVNRPFWQSIYKVDEESGGPFITGWITAFFPYVKDISVSGMRPFDKNSQNLAVRKNPLLSSGKGHLKLDDFPSGISKVSFKWDYFGKHFDMQFLSGFLGITEDDDCRLRAAINWVVGE